MVGLQALRRVRLLLLFTFARAVQLREGAGSCALSKAVTRAPTCMFNAMSGNTVRRGCGGCKTCVGRDGKSQGIWERFCAALWHVDQ